MDAPRVRFTVRRMMGGVAGLALYFFDARLATSLLFGAGAVLAVRSLLAGSNGGRPHRWALPYLVTLACLYLPFAWVLGDFPWDSYRRGWILLWPVLPGLIVGALVHPDDHMMAQVAGATTVLLVLGFSILGASGPRALVLANGAALIGAGLESWLAYQLFLF